MATLNEAFTVEDLRPIIVFQTDGDELYKLRDPILHFTPPPDLPDDVKAEIEQATQASMLRQDLESDVNFSLADIYRTADKSRATIYTVIPGFRMMNKTTEEQVALQRKYLEESQAQFMSSMSEKSRKQLKEQEERYRYYSPANLLFRSQHTVVMQTSLAAVAPRTGGWTEFLETPEQAEGIYSRIMADINSRYIVGYYPTNKAHDGTRRRIRFEIKGHPEYSILGRTAYYAPTTP
jgi:hypothetical protein